MRLNEFIKTQLFTRDQETFFQVHIESVFFTETGDVGQPSSNSEMTLESSNGVPMIVSNSSTVTLNKPGMTSGLQEMGLVLDFGIIRKCMATIQRSLRGPANSLVKFGSTLRNNLPR